MVVSTDAFELTPIWPQTILGTLRAFPPLEQPTLMLTQDLVRQRLRWNFAAKRLQKCDKVRLFARGEVPHPDLGVKPRVRISPSRVKVDHLH